MIETKIISQPGYLQDLMCVFLLYFNRPLWPNTFVDRNHLTQDIAFYNEVLDQFSEIPSGLEVFFHMNEKKEAIVPCEYLYQCQLPLEKKYHFERFIERLDDVGQMVRHVLFYYFPEESSALDPESKDYLQTMDSLIGKSAYDYNLKYSLIAFLASPKQYIQLLITELWLKRAQLSMYLRDHQQELDAVQEQFDYADYEKRAKQCPQAFGSLDETKPVFFSFCLIDRRYAGWDVANNQCTLGAEYPATLEQRMLSRRPFHLEEMGQMLSDEQRVTILNYLNREEGASVSELAGLLSNSEETALHHLTRMKECGMITMRINGQTFYYQISNDYFETAVSHLETYSRHQRTKDELDELIEKFLL